MKWEYLGQQQLPTSKGKINRITHPDVWKRGFFGWEYKGKHKDTKAAYLQLL